MSTSAAFERYHPSVQRWIWQNGFKALREAQERAAPLILDGDHDVIVAAGTGQGKTEAAFFPIWSRIVDDAGGSVRVLYVAPLKALINDQLFRQTEFCEANGIRVTAWHGDVSANKKRDLIKTPAGILLITPESLESILVRHGHGAARVFERLDRVVVDEIHAFFDTERGRQLQSLLARIEAMIGRRVPRIGLSATLGDDPEAAADFLRPGHGPAVKLPSVDDAGKELQLVVHGFEVATSSEESKAGPGDPDAPQDDADDVDSGFHAVRDRLYRSLRDGSRHLIFANRRDHVEKLADLLRRRSELEKVPNEFFAHHGSLSKELRETVEDRLKNDRSRPTIVVCTSTLEMGIDIGDMKSVAQVGCPPSVAALRQRVGRSGRGEEEPHVLRQCVVEPQIDARASVPDRLRVELVQCVAMIDLMVVDRWCEPPRAARHHFSTLLQQTMALIMQNGGVRAQHAWSLLCESGPFRRVGASDFSTLLRGMAKADLLLQTPDGTLVLTEKGERITNHYGFYVVFQTGEEYRLISRGKTIGHLPVTEPLAPGLYLIFAGRRWRIVSVDDAKKIVELVPDKGGRTPKFDGRGGALVHDRVRERMRDIYATKASASYLDKRASKLIEEGCETFHSLGLEHHLLIEEGPRTRWFPWRGDRVVNTLVLWLKAREIRATSDGVSLEVDLRLQDLRRELAGMATGAAPDPLALAEEVQNLQSEKYDWIVPRELLVSEYAERFLDVAGALASVRAASGEGAP